MKFRLFSRRKDSAAVAGAPADPLQRFREGDARAFDEIVDSFSPGIVRLFRRHGADPATADDLAQEVFIRLFKTESHYESRGRLQVYLYRIARNVWLDWKRAASSRPPTRSLDVPGVDAGMPPLALLVNPAIGPLEVVVGRDASRALAGLLARLNERDRTILELAVFEGMRYAEVAEALSIPEGTVKSRVFHAVRKLRALAAGAGDLRAAGDSSSGEAQAGLS